MPAEPATLDLLLAEVRALRADVAELRAGAGGLLSAARAAKFLGLGKTAFYARVGTRGFPVPVAGAGDRPKYRRGDLERWLRARKPGRTRRRDDHDAPPAQNAVGEAAE